MRYKVYGNCPDRYIKSYPEVEAFWKDPASGLPWYGRGDRTGLVGPVGEERPVYQLYADGANRLFVLEAGYLVPIDEWKAEHEPFRK